MRRAQQPAQQQKQSLDANAAAQPKSADEEKTGGAGAQSGSHRACSNGGSGRSSPASALQLPVKKQQVQDKQGQPQASAKDAIEEGNIRSFQNLTLTKLDSYLWTWDDVETPSSQKELAGRSDQFCDC